MKKMMPLLLGLLLAGVGFGVYTLFLSGGGGTGETPAQARQHLTAKLAAEKKHRLADRVEGPTVLLGDPFTVNLADRGSSWYARFSVALTFDSSTPFEAAGEEAAAAAKPEEFFELREIVTDVVGSHPAEQLSTREGRETIKKEIVEAVNKETAKTVALAVYFSDLAVQQAA